MTDVLSSMRRPLSIDARKAALLCIDLQEEHRKDQRYLVEGFDAVLGNTRSLQDAARRNGISVLHCAYVVDLDSKELRPFHPVGSDGKSAFSDKDDPWTAICPEVEPAPGETMLVKSEASAFGDGRLAELLGKNRIEWLFIAGVWSEACVDATVRDAVKFGVHVILVKDACGSGTATMHQTAMINLANRLYGGAVIDAANACRVMQGVAVKAWQVEGAVPLRFTSETIAEVYDGL